MITGIDEAGRGPVLGPLVVAAVRANPEDLPEGLKDSKRLTPAKREHLARLLLAHPEIDCQIRVILAEELDAMRATKTLNEIEVDAFQQLALALPSAMLYLDAADVNAERFGIAVAGEAPVVSEHKADDRYPIVAAASIIAKTTRDQAIAELAKYLERELPMSMGSGYPGDAKTREFLVAYHRKFGRWPKGARKSWKTLSNLPTSTLADF